MRPAALRYKNRGRVQARHSLRDILISGQVCLVAAPDQCEHFQIDPEKSPYLPWEERTNEHREPCRLGRVQGWSERWAGTDGLLHGSRHTVTPESATTRAAGELYIRTCGAG